MAKSRIGWILLATLAAPAQAADPPALQQYQQMTSVEPRCSAPRAANEIIVCGRRRADRWRVPHLLKETGDPSIQNVSAERNALIRTTTLCQEHSIFLVGCGKGVGIGATIGLGGGPRAVKLRPLAD